MVGRAVKEPPPKFSFIFAAAGVSRGRVHHQGMPHDREDDRGERFEVLNGLQVIEGDESMLVIVTEPFTRGTAMERPHGNISDSVSMLDWVTLLNKTTTTEPLLARITTPPKSPEKKRVHEYRNLQAWSALLLLERKDYRQCWRTTCFRGSAIFLIDFGCLGILMRLIRGHQSTIMYSKTIHGRGGV